MARKRKGPRIYWRNGRAYGDFRAYEEVGGGREALSEPGSTWGTTDQEVAEELFAKRLNELKEKKRGRVGLERSITLARLARDHLKQKAETGQTSDRHLYDLETRLKAAAEYFGKERDLRTITPEDVRDWVRVLSATSNGRGGTLAPVTQRNYLFALSGLYRRAQEGRYVPAGYNPVSMLVEKPAASPSGEAAFFEVPEAALLLEAARVVERQDRRNATPGLYAIVATFLLTGGRKSEVLGLDVEDVSLDRKRIYVRPNAHRGLKTRTSHRIVPLWPQLEEVLREWLFGGSAPRTSGLLFPGRDGSKVGSLRKSLDGIGELCGFEEGEVRTRRFRHTYCAARLQTVQRIVRPGADPAVDEDPYEWVPVQKFTVQREMGHGGSALVDRVYGHVGDSPHRSEVVEYRVQKHRDELGERLRVLGAASA